MLKRLLCFPCTPLTVSHFKLASTQWHVPYVGMKIDRHAWHDVVLRAGPLHLPGSSRPLNSTEVYQVSDQLLLAGIRGMAGWVQVGSSLCWHATALYPILSHHYSIQLKAFWMTQHDASTFHVIWRTGMCLL